MNRIYDVDHTDEERTELAKLLAGGKPGARVVKRAQILLAADGNHRTDGEIAPALSSSTSTVFRTRKCFVVEGLAPALAEKPRTGEKALLCAAQEAALVAPACS